MNGAPTINSEYSFPKEKLAEFKQAVKDVFYTPEGKEWAVFGYNDEGSRCVLRSGFENAELAKIGVAFTAFHKKIAEYTTVEKCQIHASEEDLATFKATPAAENVKEFFVAVPGAFRKGPSDASTLTLSPYFSVKDADKVKAFLPEFSAATKDETECLFYGWTKNTADPTVIHCREGYTCAAGLMTHLGNVDALLKKMLAPELASISYLECHGSRAEVEKVKEALVPLGTVFYYTD